jgi:hypothetical protein
MLPYVTKTKKPATAGFFNCAKIQRYLITLVI